MSDSFKRLNKASMIRIVLFICLILWAIYCFIAYSIEFNGGSGLSGMYVNTSDIKDIYIDGSDFTWAMRLMGVGINGMVSVAIFILVIVLMFAEALFVLVPTLLLKFIGLNKKLILTVSEDELKITKTIYLAAIVISLILGFAITGFIAVIPKLFLDITWMLVSLIYVSGLKYAVERKNFIEQQKFHENDQL